MAGALALLATAAAGAPAGASAAASARGTGERVFRLDPLLDGAAIAVASAASVLPWLLEDRIMRLRCPCDPAEVNRFDRPAIGLSSEAATLASNVTLWAALAAPPVLDLALLGWDRALLDDLVLFAETLAVNGALVTTMKYFLWQRPIPRAYAGEPDYLREPGSYRAFWSGHTSTVTAALTHVAWTLRLRDGETVWPWAVAAVGGASVAAERVLGGHHFASDVLVGLVVGAAVGTAVPLLHERRARGGAPVAVIPARAGLRFGGRF